jgi:hypothetical protein
VTAITGNEPFHWHDAAGRHAMTDPRTIDGYSERWWDADERLFVTHLQTHEGEKSDPKRCPDDSDAVKALFDLWEARERECGRIRALIAAHREHTTAKRAIETLSVEL